MKATLLAAVALAIGVGIGSFLTQREFARDVLPLDVTQVSGAKPGQKIGPKAVIVNGVRHDFGKMDRTEHRRHDFTVRNDGDEQLTLSTGEPSCGACVKVFRVEKDRLAPGETTSVVFEWEARPNESEFEQSGPLNTNDPFRPTITLTVRGQVLDTVRAERTDVHFHDISANEAANGSINIYSFRTPDLVVEKHTFHNEALAKFFTVTFAPLASDEIAKEANAKGGQKMSIEIKPGMPLGRIQQSIRVLTNQSAESPITINIHGNVISDIALASGTMIAPDKLLVGLGTFPSREGAKRTVYLIVKGPYRDETKLQVASTDPTREFSATLGEPLRDNPKIVRYPLTIEVPAGARPVNHYSEGAYAQVRLTSTHPDVKELTIKVRYVVTE
jgi:hypothetical protein